MDKSQRERLLGMIDNSGPSSKDDRVLIIDGMNIFVSVFAAVPQLNENGDHIGGVAGFIKSVGARIRQFNATRCIVVFDGSGGSKRRKKLYPDYKANRKGNKTTLNRWGEFDGYIDEQESMRKQFARIVEYMEYLPITVISIDGIEADDTIAYITRSIYGDSYEGLITIVSADRDFLQLVSPNVQIWSPIKKKLYDVELMRKEFDLPPKNYVLYRAFSGDQSDNIPGVNGVGLKTLKKRFPEVIEREVDIEHFIKIASEQIEGGSKLKLWKNVVSNKEVLERNYKLMQLDNTDIPSSAEYLIEKFMSEPITNLNEFKVLKMFIEDGMDKSIKDLNRWLRDTIYRINIYAG